MRCPAVDVEKRTCGARLPEFPSPWLAAGLEFCSPKCAERADNQLHTHTRNVPSDRWMADHDARQERRRLDERRAS